MAGYSLAPILADRRYIGSVRVVSGFAEAKRYDWTQATVRPYARTQARKATVPEMYQMAQFIDYAKYRKEATEQLLARYPDAQAQYLAQRSRNIHMRQYRAYCALNAISKLVAVYHDSDSELVA